MEYSGDTGNPADRASALRLSGPCFCQGTHTPRPCTQDEINGVNNEVCRNAANPNSDPIISVTYDLGQHLNLLGRGQRLRWLQRERPAPLLRPRKSWPGLHSSHHVAAGAAAQDGWHHHDLSFWRPHLRRDLSHHGRYQRYRHDRHRAHRFPPQNSRRWWRVLRMLLRSARFTTALAGIA